MKNGIRTQNQRIKNFFDAVKKELERVPLDSTPRMSGIGYSNPERTKKRAVQFAATELQVWLILTGGRTK